MSKPTAATLLALALASCTTVPAKTQIELTRQEARGYSFAKAHCAACHGIIANATSANPEAPPFEAVVNTKGLTATTLTTFLRDSHNFPGAMAFKIEPQNVNDLTDYMITLKRADYRPAP